MKRTRRSATSLCIMACLFAFVQFATEVKAEPVAALYIGYAGTDDNPYYADGEPLPPAVTCISSCGSAHSPVGGIRVGYWFERLPWLGVAGDFSVFTTGWGVQSPFEIESYPLSALLEVRGRLIKQEGYANGRIQPYLAFGPSMYISTATVGSGWAIIGTSSQASDTSVAIGLDARVGVEILTTNWFGILLEYRYSYAKPSWEIEGTDFETKLSTDHFTLGIMAHF